MNRYGIIFCSLLSLLWLCTCKPKVLYDLTNEKVVQIAPIAGVSLKGYTQTLSWAKLNDAISYESLIIPTAYPDSVVLDTVIISNPNILTYTFAPGDYTWKIKAHNGLSSTGFTSTTFSIQVSPLDSSITILSYPKNGGYSAKDTTLLTWHAMYQPVDGYQVQVSAQNDFTGTLLLDSTTANTSLGFIPTTQSIYYWRVRAYTSTDTSFWSTVYSFTFDNIPPAKPVLTSPVNDTTGVIAAGTLNWNSVEVLDTYNVYITYGTNATKKFTATTITYNYSGTTGEIIYWQVEAVDPAGNVGPLSDKWNFKIQ